MNLFVSNPHWGWWIILYFYLGGIAAGGYFLSVLIELFGPKHDRDVARAGYALAFPFVLVCAVFLIVDLNRPERFWHMIADSQVVDAAIESGWPTTLTGWQTIAAAPLMKYWSPMSIGAWALSLFGLCSFVSFIAAVRPNGLVNRWYSFGWVGYPVRIAGCCLGFFVAAYTGVLLTASNQPIWSDSVWVGPLFLASASSTGLAALLLLGWRHLSEPTLNRLHRADLWVLSLELTIFLIFLASLGPLLLPLLESVAGLVLVAGTSVVGLLIPLLVHVGLGRRDKKAALTAAACVLVGGFMLRWGIVSAPPQLLSEAKQTTVHSGLMTNFGPESGRVRGDVDDPPASITPRSKVYDP